MSFSNGNHKARTFTRVSFGGALALLLGVWGMSQARVVLINASHSMPRGVWYTRALEDELEPGDIVYLRSNTYAVDAGITFEDQVLLKYIAATHRDRVCLADEVVRVNSSSIGSIKAHTREGDPIQPAWEGCRELRAEDAFLVGQHPDSYDSRYFGVIPTHELLGRAYPLLLIDELEPPTTRLTQQEDTHEH